MPKKNATAVPLRTRLNYGTADWVGLSLFVECDYVADFGPGLRTPMSSNHGRGATLVWGR
jgi:hypothetical protein